MKQSNELTKEELSTIVGGQEFGKNYWSYSPVVGYVPLLGYYNGYQHAKHSS
ncbi:bacteriocin class II family protein [Streptococcus tangpeifui]|uniref:bacteriocin class II family protein n=1 Tax=Streptococcus tangpeifui TaxID=2709400 RepID=UPI0013ED17C1|nr:bacteriocin class II family protein [Streptococcus sp. ZJ1593]